MDDRTIADLQVIQDGSKLDLALRTEPGQIIQGALIEYVAQRIMTLLDARDTQDIDLLRTLSHIHGVIDALGDIGEKINLARGIAARRVKEQLRQKGE